LARLSLVVLLVCVLMAGSAGGSGAAPPDRSLNEAIENLSPPDAQYAARWLRLIKPSWNVYAQDVSEWRRDWCFHDARRAIRNMLNRLWRPDTRATPALTHLIVYLRSGCPLGRSVDYWANETAGAFNRRVLKELTRQASLNSTAYQRGTPAVREQKRNFTDVGRLACGSAGVLVTAWVNGRYSGRTALLGLAAIAGAQVYCPKAVNNLLQSQLG
jgi:hypothetical protein